ncbi:MAG: hypothetical protein SFW64_01830 [Alphaproteobacteria bacterium]|nr:hypothetical protein [Alphaproteobacteria bacterium]
MRWLRRLVIFWAVSGTLFYVFGMPMLLDFMSRKVQRDGYTQCITQMTEQKQIGSPNSPLSQEQGEHYCRCTSDSLMFTPDDLSDAIQKKPPAALTAQAQSLAEQCQRDLQQSLGFLPTDAN